MDGLHQLSLIQPLTLDRRTYFGYAQRMRTYTKTLGAFFLVPLLAVIGCGPTDNNTTGGGGGGGEGGSGGSGGSGNAGSLDQVAQEVSKAFCANAVDCHTAETEADCLAASNAQVEAMEAYVANGTVIYHPEKLDACLAALKGAFSCSISSAINADPESSITGACNPVFEGTVPENGACFDDEQCVSNECETDPNCMEQCCEGKCAAAMADPTPAKIGESCAAANCESGAYCQTDMMGMPTTCAAKIAMGQPCSDIYACAAPGVCNIDFQSGMGTCAVPPAEGATCNPNTVFPCDRLDNVCDQASMKCVLKGLDGAACTDNGDCVEYAHCEAGGKCAKDPGKGGTCDAMDDNCLGDLQCINSICGFEPTVVCQ